MLNFLKVLSRHGRLDCLRAVHRQVHTAIRRTARPRFPCGFPRPRRLSDAEVAAGIDRRRASKTLRRRPSRSSSSRPTDAKLIGGLVVRVGDTVYDGSVANQLQQMRQQMIDRSAHEIQSRRNRFRDPAGD